MNARKCKHRISDHKRERGYACTIRILSLPYTNTITKIYFPLQVMASNDITQTFSQSDVLLIIMAHTILNTTTTIYAAYHTSYNNICYNTTKHTTKQMKFNNMGSYTALS